MLTDKEIEDYAYRDNGDYSSADEIEPWIAGAKWYRDMQLKFSSEKITNYSDIEK